MSEQKSREFREWWIQANLNKLTDFDSVSVWDAFTNPQSPSNYHVIEYRALEQAQAENAMLREALAELADLMDDVRTGDYKPDSFTTQPARTALGSGGGG